MIENPEIEQQFLILIEQNKSRIHRICSVYARSTEDQKDLVQDVLFNIWKALPNFQNKSNIDTWIYRIVLNICLRSKYEKERKHKIQLNGLEIIYNESEPKNIKYEQLYHCISQLKTTDKSVIILFLEDMSYKEIGHILGLSDNHVAVKIKRIKIQLLNCLKGKNNGR